MLDEFETARTLLTTMAIEVEKVAMKHLEDDMAMEDMEAMAHILLQGLRWPRSRRTRAAALRRHPRHATHAHRRPLRPRSASPRLLSPRSLTTYVHADDAHAGHARAHRGSQIRSLKLQLEMDSMSRSSMSRSRARTTLSPSTRSWVRGGRANTPRPQTDDTLTRPLAHSHTHTWPAPTFTTHEKDYAHADNAAGTKRANDNDHHDDNHDKSAQALTMAPTGGKVRLVPI